MDLKHLYYTFLGRIRFIWMCQEGNWKSDKKQKTSSNRKRWWEKARWVSHENPLLTHFFHQSVDRNWVQLMLFFDLLGQRWGTSHMWLLIKENKWQGPSNSALREPLICCYHSFSKASGSYRLAARLTIFKKKQRW